MTPTCPVCGGTTFGTYNGRADAVCVACKSLERGRLQYLVMRHLGLPRPGSRILHVAPEPFLHRIFRACSGELYHPADFEPDHRNYARLEGGVYEIDLCRDLARMPTAVFDLIVHNHVLEHIPCAVDAVLREHLRILAPGGHIVFSVPIRGDRTEEDLDPGLSPEVRKARFAQGDHMRIFGRVDLPAMLREAFGRDTLFDTALWSDEDLRGHAIPPDMARGVTGSSTFVYAA